MKKKPLIITLSIVVCLAVVGGVWYWMQNSSTDSLGSSEIQPVKVDDTADKTTAQVLESNSRFKQFNALVAATGVNQTLQATEPHTVFAPTDEAFDAMANDTSSALSSLDVAAKKTIVLYHVVKGEVLVASMQNAQKIPTLNGREFVVSAEDQEVYITSTKGEKAKLITTDIKTSNGVIHAIDAVLLPQ